MAYFCAGVTADSLPCLNRVSSGGDYCRCHSSQKEKKSQCACLLMNGEQCGLNEFKNGLCEFHQVIRHCKGNTLLGNRCMRVIPEGDYCTHCIGQKGPVFPSISALAVDHRLHMASKGNTYIPPVTRVKISMTKPIIIPENIKPVDLEKPEDCAICMCELDNESPLKCGHYFHMECLSKTHKPECPVCRKEFTHLSVPRWVLLRIKESSSKSFVEDQNERLIQDSIDMAMQTQEQELQGANNNLPQMQIYAIEAEEGLIFGLRVE